MDSSSESGDHKVEMCGLGDDLRGHDVSPFLSDTDEDLYETSRSSQMSVEYHEKWFENPKYFHGAVSPGM